tara:strand:+ start:1562 stop:2992 length:1431 start_codon:yes stop_codon:yes gene_type:complete
MSKTVNKRSDVMAKIVEASKKGRALMGGTDSMRQAGKTYLPKFEAESDHDYKARLNSSFLFNGLRKTIKDMTGRVFNKSIEIVEGSDSLKKFARDINMQGQDLSAFASDVFKDAFVPGISYIMVDAPRREGETTRAQAASQGLRPYMVHLRVEDILGFQTNMFNNVLALSMLRIMESVTETDPSDEFSQITIPQVRVITREEGVVYVRIYRKNNKEEWLVFDAYLTNAQEITVIPFYAQRTGFFTAEPVLEDLADVNIAHFQSQSDQRHILHFARVPILFASGRGDDEPLVISASQAVTSLDPAGTLQWVEHSGAAINAGRNDLQDLAQQMQALGLQLLVSSHDTATGAMLDSTKETSTLSMMADNLKDALEVALGWMAFYAGEAEQSIKVEVNKDFGIVPLTAQEVQVMQADVNLGLLSKEAYYAERKRRGFLSPDLDTERDMDLIESTSTELTGDALDISGPSPLDSAVAALNG